jgi:hypothetical protein
MAFNSYQTIYGVQLIDDLHNYYPDVLYGPPGQFRTVDDLLGYVRQRTQQRFDLFTYGRLLATPIQMPAAGGSASANPNAIASPPPTNANAAATNANSNAPPATPPPTNTQSPTNSNAAAAPPAAPRRQVQRISRQGPISLFGSALTFGDLDPFGDNLLASDPLVTNLLSHFINPNSNIPNIGLFPSNFAAPVVVRPTAAQIAAGSEIISLPGNAEPDVCTICQDTLPLNTNTIRKLRSCGHMFHQTCIDAWFERNVRCPMCRHDIREQTVTPSQAAATVTENQAPLSDEE